MEAVEAGAGTWCRARCWGRDNFGERGNIPVRAARCGSVEGGAWGSPSASDLRRRPMRMVRLSAIPARAEAGFFWAGRTVGAKKTPADLSRAALADRGAADDRRDGSLPGRLREALAGFHGRCRSRRVAMLMAETRRTGAWRFPARRGAGPWRPVRARHDPVWDRDRLSQRPLAAGVAGDRTASNGSQWPGTPGGEALPSGTSKKGGAHSGGLAVAREARLGRGRRHYAPSKTGP